MTAAREELQALVAESLRDVTYTCGRVWEAWQYGTMTDEDFAPAWEDDGLTGSMADEIMKAIKPRLAQTVGRLDALAPGTVIAQLDNDGILVMAAAKDAEGLWGIAGDCLTYRGADILRLGWPAIIVLHESTPAATHG